MKKFLLGLAALALSTGAAFAQSAPFINNVTFSVTPSAVEDFDEDENVYYLNAPNVTLTMEFDGWNKAEADALGYAPKLMVATGMGFGVEPVIYDLDSETSTFLFPMNEERWGQPYMSTLNAVCMVCFAKGEGDDMEFYMTDDEEPLFYQALMTAPNTFPARFMFASPNGVWEDETFAEAYDRGEIGFTFTNPVEFANATIGNIKFFSIEGDEDSAPIKKYNSEWDMLNGLWVVSFDFRHEEWSADDISKIVIELTGIESVIGGSAVPVEPVILNNVASPRKVKKSIEKGLISGNELVNIYNVQGTLIKENVNKSTINELPAGLYIIDGKKVVVR